MKKVLIFLLFSSMAIASDEMEIWLEDSEELTQSTFSDAERVDAIGFFKVLLTSKDPEYNVSLLAENNCVHVMQQGHEEAKVKYAGCRNGSNRKEDIIGRLMSNLSIKNAIIPAGPPMSKQLIYLMIEFKKRQTIQELEKKVPVTSLEFSPNDDSHCEKILADWHREYQRKKAFAEKVRGTSYLPFLIRKEPMMAAIDFARKK